MNKFLFPNCVSVYLVVLVTLLIVPSFREVLGEEVTINSASGGGGGGVSGVSGRGVSSTGDEILIALDSKSIPKAFEDFKNNRFQWIKQKLDHLNDSDTQQWSQRYFEYGGYYKPGGPVFLNIDGEGPGLASPIDLIKKGSFAQYAKEQGAYILALEHRYYGLSHPTSDLSNENLKFLSVSQAVRDIGYFVQQLKTERHFEQNKWVVFGSSYGGSLAKWFTQMYPNRTDILVASSAPLELKYDMPDYIEMVGKVINRTSPQCFQDLMSGFNCLEATINGKPCGDYQHQTADLQNIFNLCGSFDIKNEQDISGLFYTIFNIFNNIVVNDIPDSKINVGLEGVCKSLTSSGNGTHSPLVRLGQVVKEITEASEVSCIEYRLEKIVKYLQQTSWKSLANHNGDRQFQWQRCNELGWVKGSKEPKMPFGARISTSFYAEVCQRVFGISEETMIKKIDEANSNYKGKKIETSCGIFVNGNADPWSTLGVRSEDEAGECNRAIIIEGGSHGKDKGNIQHDISTTVSHPPDLRSAQKEIGKILGTWLKSGKCCEPKAIPHGRILTDRYFFPIPENFTIGLTQPRPAVPKVPFSILISNAFIPNNRSKAASLEIKPNPHLPIVNSTVINHNDIDSQDSKRSEIRVQAPDLDKVVIQKGVEFRELSEFIKKHEKEFVMNNSERRRYRVKIRKPDEKDTNGNETFSKFGIKIRMVDMPKGNHSDDRVRIARRHDQWSHWTDFGAKQSLVPNPKTLTIDTSKNTRHHPHVNSSNTKTHGDNHHHHHHSHHKSNHTTNEDLIRHVLSSKPQLPLAHHNRPQISPVIQDQIILERSHLNERDHITNPPFRFEEDPRAKNIILRRIHQNNARAILPNTTTVYKMEEDSTKHVKVKLNISMKSSKENSSKDKNNSGSGGDKNDDEGKALSSSSNSEEDGFGYDKLKVDHLAPTNKRRRISSSSGNRKTSVIKIKRKKSHNKSTTQQRNSELVPSASNENDDTIPAIGSHEDGPMFLNKGKDDIAKVNAWTDFDDIDNSNSVENPDTNSTSIRKIPQFFAFGSKGGFLPRMRKINDESQSIEDTNEFQDAEASNESFSEEVLPNHKKSSKRIKIKVHKAQKVPKVSVRDSAEDNDKSELARRKQSLLKWFPAEIEQKSESENDKNEDNASSQLLRKQSSKEVKDAPEDDDEGDIGAPYFYLKPVRTIYPKATKINPDDETGDEEKDEMVKGQAVSGEGNQGVNESSELEQVIPKRIIKRRRKLRKSRTESGMVEDEVSLNQSDRTEEANASEEFEFQVENDEKVRSRGPKLRKKGRRDRINNLEDPSEFNYDDENEDFIAQTLKIDSGENNESQNRNDASEDLNQNENETDIESSEFESQKFKNNNKKSRKASKTSKVPLTSSEEQAKVPVPLETSSETQNASEDADSNEESNRNSERLNQSRKSPSDDISIESTESNESGAKEIVEATDSTEFNVSSDENTSSSGSSNNPKNTDSNESSGSPNPVSSNESNEVGGEKASSEDGNLNAKGQDETSPQSLAASEDKDNKDNIMEAIKPASESTQSFPDDKTNFDKNVTTFREEVKKLSTEEDIREFIEKIRRGNNDVEYHVIVKPHSTSDSKIEEDQNKSVTNSQALSSPPTTLEVNPQTQVTWTTSSESPLPPVPAVAPEVKSPSLANKDANQFLSTSPPIIMLRGKPIPPRMLNWRALSQESPKATIVDMSVDHKPQNLALTAEDVAWVNFGVNTMPGKVAQKF